MSVVGGGKGARAGLSLLVGCGGDWASVPSYPGPEMILGTLVGCWDSVNVGRRSHPPLSPSALTVAHNKLLKGIAGHFEPQRQSTSWPGGVIPEGVQRHQFWRQGFRKVQEDSII